MKTSYKTITETCFYAFILMLLYYIQYQNTGHIYLDSDNYTHALRAIDFMKDPSMFERVFPLTNYPFGEISHWTRLMDIIFALCALPFLFFMDLKDAVFNGSFLIVPLCAFATLYLLQKIGEKWFSLGSRFALYAILLISIQTRTFFKINRPDHQALLFLFAVWILWLFCKYIDDKKKNIIFAASAICAVALWLSVEGIFLYAAALMFLYIGYLTLNFPYRDMIRFSTGYLIGVLICLCINPPIQGYFYVDNGRLSILYLALAAVVPAVLFVFYKVKNKIMQFIELGISAIATLAVLWFGGYMTSPLIPEIAVSFTNRISEMQGGGSIYYMAYPTLGIFSLLYLLMKKRNIEAAVLIGCFLLPYMLLSIWAIRFAAYAVLFSAMAIALWLKEMHFTKVKFSILLILLCLTEIVSLTIDVLIKYDLSEPVNQEKIFDINFLKKYNFQEGSVVSDIFMTPHIIWLSGHPTVASPYHRNTEGIIDNHNIFMLSDMDEVSCLIKKHDVGTIILPMFADDNYYKKAEENTDKLYGKMFISHEYPDWLKEDIFTLRYGYVVLRVLKDKIPCKKNDKEQTE